MSILTPADEKTAGAHLALSPESIYQIVKEGASSRGRAHSFTTHALACALTVGLIEAQQHGKNLSDTLGLDRTALDLLTTQWTPGARRLFDLDEARRHICLDEEETQLHDLLSRFRADDSPLGGCFVSIVARRAMYPRHLWQDLGLLERTELTRLMNEWFPALAAANVHNMKWKKFFYRQLCELEGFSLCATPSCRECGDFDHCFGAEDGTSLLARLRLSAP